MRLGFRHCDSRFGFLWQVSIQPPARWHAAGSGPANYFADTPTGAWAEFLRHEGITDAADLPGVRRSLWAVELPEEEYGRPTLDDATLLGGEQTYPDCQAEAERLRQRGFARLEAPAAALLPGGASGFTSSPTLSAAKVQRDGRVWVLFGPCDAVGWPAVVDGAPPTATLSVVRPL